MAHSVKTIDGGQRSFVLDVGETAERHREFLAVAALGDFLTRFHHIAVGHLQPLAGMPELLTGALHAIILAVRRDAPRLGIVEAERNYSPRAGSRQAKNADSVLKAEQGAKSGEIGCE